MLKPCGLDLTAHVALYFEVNDLVEYLVRSSRLSSGEARRVVEEVMNFFDELPEEFIRRRHLALQSHGLSNSEIFVRLADELRRLRFRAPEYSERQIRRMIYG
jgi:polyhydroxyalkanoate synthesis regulator phasin